MIATHRLFDDVYFAVLLAIPAAEWRWVWPRFLRRVASGEPHVRVRFYRGIIFGQWILALSLLACWTWWKRPWPWLLLGPSTPLRLGAGLAGAALIAVFLAWQRVQVLGNEKAIDSVKRQLGSAAPLLPHSCAENRIFKVVAVTAGVCEEILFRGFLLWYFADWTGTLGAVVLSSLVFGFGHLYLGRAHVLKTTIAGVFFACLVLVCGSLWPAILIHAAMDWNSGDLGYRIVTRSAAPA